MKIALHQRINENRDSFSFRWIERLKEKNITHKVIDFNKSDLIDHVRNYDGVLWHWFHLPDDKQAAPKILNAIEFGLKIPVFPNKATRWHYDEKISQHYLFDSIEAPKIKSWVFWNKTEAMEFINKTNYPIVFKLSVGAGSANVLKINNKDEAYRCVETMFGDGLKPYTINEFEELQQIVYPHILSRLKDCAHYMLKRRPPRFKIKTKHWYYLIQKNYIYFQEYIPGNHYDIRVTVIGKRAFAFIRHNRPDDFRASGSGDFDTNPKNIPLEAVRIAFDVSTKLNFQSMAYDFLLGTNNKVLLNEISYCYANWAVHKCEGFWDDQLNWHSGNIWPEDAILEDFLNYLDNR